MKFIISTRSHNEANDVAQIDVVKIDRHKWVVEAKSEDQAMEKLQAVLDATAEEGGYGIYPAHEEEIELFDCSVDAIRCVRESLLSEPGSSEEPASKESRSFRRWREDLERKASVPR